MLRVPSALVSPDAPQLQSRGRATCRVPRDGQLRLRIAFLLAALAGPFSDSAPGTTLESGSAGAGPSTPAQTAQEIPDRVAWWRAEGNGYDSTGSRDGTLEDGVSFAAGRLGSSFSFDGLDDTVRVPDGPGLDLSAGVTIASWVRMEACTFVHGWCAILGKSVDGWAFNFNYGLIVSSDGQMSFISGDGSAYILDYRGPDVRGAWHHLAVTYDESELRYYVDGLEVHSASVSVPLTPNGADLQIGSLDDGTGDAAELEGELDEVMLFARALTSAEIRELAADFSPLVAGVSQVGTPYQVSSLVASSSSWVGIVGGDDDSSLSSTTVAARGLGFGRVVAMQANGLGLSLGTLDNGALFTNVAAWLRGSGASTIGYLTGHGEALESEWIGAWEDDGFSVSAVPAPLTPGGLTGLSVLVVAHNLASGAHYQPLEATAILDFVHSGGGLLLIGLGWPDPAHGAGRRLAEELGIGFAADLVADPTDNFGSAGAPKFQTFHPEVELLGLSHARTVLRSSHLANPGSWPIAMDDPNARRSYLRAGRGVDLLGMLSPEDSAVRDSTHHLFLDLFDDETTPGAAAALARSRRYEPDGESMAGFAREFLLKAWFGSIRLPAHAELAELAELAPIQAELVSAVPVIVLDNAGLDAHQSQFLGDLLTLVPTSLHRLRQIAFEELIGDPAPGPGLPPELSWDEFFAQRPGDVAINTFASPIGVALGNPFSEEVPAYWSDLFTGALVHELNHAVDAVSAYGIPARAARRAELLARAGCDHLNFLRSVIEDCWFQANPGELIASTANMFGVFSERTLDVALLRMAAGRYEPMNQFLFMLELYSGGGDHSYFWRVTSEAPPATVQRWQVPLTRNGEGFIQSFDWDGDRYSFTLDDDSWVTGLSIEPLPPLFSDGFESGNVSAWSTSTGYVP